MKATAIATPLVAAIEGAWSAIQANHEDVPDVVVTLGSGLVRAGLKFGHFAANSWTKPGDDDKAEKVHELFVGGEGLARGERALMGTLIHEAAHAWAEANEIKDTSRQGRYHNDKFRLIAETFGLKLTHDPSLGWSTTELPDETAAEYEEAIFNLGMALTAHRQMPSLVAVPTTTTGGTVSVPRNPGRASSNNGVVLHCKCNRRIRLSLKALEMGAITCNVCGEEFA
jgi:hypothetical protein